MIAFWMSMAAKRKLKLKALDDLVPPIVEMEKINLKVVRDQRVLKRSNCRINKK